MAVPGRYQCPPLGAAPTETCGAWVLGILQGGLLEPLCLSLKINAFFGLPWWLSGKESTCPDGKHRFNPWAGEIPCSVKQLNLRSAATEPVLCVLLQETPCNEKPPAPTGKAPVHSKEDPAQPGTNKIIFKNTFISTGASRFILNIPDFPTTIIKCVC